MSLSSTYKPDPALSSLADETGSSAYFDPVEPASFPQSTLRYRNQRAAKTVGLEDISDAEWNNYFGAFKPLDGNLPQPLALRYHGHQFRHYNSDLGDGRGFIHAQLRDSEGRLMDLGTKGSGQTRWSRSGDGRLTLKGGVRELLATHMLEALGVYTSKTFSLIETGEDLYRQDEPSPARSCVMVRLSHSHIRFGAFQRLAYEKDGEAISRLIDYCIAHYMPGLQSLEGDARILGFYKTVIENTARLTAQWMAAGFVHGVLNTDNMNITGESFDYGPWRFVPRADPNFTAAYFDQTGLYAYGRQGEAAGWNLARLGEALTLCTALDPLVEALQSFAPLYDDALAEAFWRRLGLTRDGQESAHSGTAVMSLLKAIGTLPEPPDGFSAFEQVLFDFYGAPARHKPAKASIYKAHYETETFTDALQPFLDSSLSDDAQPDHPYFANPEPCTMLIDEVEQIWAPIAQKDDWSALHAKLAKIDVMREAYGLAGGLAGGLADEVNGS